MTRLAFALLIVCVLGCKKSNQAGIGSGNVGSGGSGSAAAGSGGAGIAAFDDKLELPKQPARPKDEQARVDGAADALRTALTQATTAKDSAELCKAFEPLKEAMKNLQMVTAPKGMEEDFSSDRDALLQSFDEAGTDCDNPANVGLDTLRDLMSEIRKQFVALVGLGAK